MNELIDHLVKKKNIFTDFFHLQDTYRNKMDILQYFNTQIKAQRSKILHLLLFSFLLGGSKLIKNELFFFDNFMLGEHYYCITLSTYN